MFITSYLIAYCSVLRVWYIEMFITRCSSFCSILPCSFESILMPKSLVQECYMLLTVVTYQNMRICYFCCYWCVRLMGMSSTCVLMYDMPYLQRCMPCIFVISLVTSTNIQTRLRDVSDFRDLVILPSLWLLLFCCFVSMWLQRDPCLFWWCSVRMFCRYCCSWSIHALVCNYGVP